MSVVSIAQGRLRTPVTVFAFPIVLAIVGVAKVAVPMIASHHHAPAAIDGAVGESRVVALPRIGATVRHEGIWFDRMALASQRSLDPCRFEPANAPGLRVLFLRRDSRAAREPVIALPPVFVARPLVALLDVRAGHRHGVHVATIGRHGERRHAFRLTFDDLAADGIEGIATDSSAPDAAASPAKPAPSKPQAGQGGVGNAAAHPLFVADADLGQFDTSARAVALNGQAAAALSVAYDPGLGGLKLKASGAAEVVGMSDLTTLRHSFKLSTVASLPLY